MNILVRLPTKLGDTVMATSFLNSLHEQYPDASVDVVIQKPIADLYRFLPHVHDYYAFSRKEHKGVSGLYRFGKMIGKKKKYDLYFSLPISFSAALIGFFSGSRVRVGFKWEARSFLLTHSYKMKKRLHTVKQLVYLLSKYVGKDLEPGPVHLIIPEENSRTLPEGRNLLFNVNSGAQARRVPVGKAVSIVEDVLKRYDFNVILIGGPGEVQYVKQIEDGIKDKSRVVNLTGKTDMQALAGLIKDADFMISADSGNAHLANALGLKVVVLWGGCGREEETSPYIRKGLKILKKDLPCAPCWPSENCKFGDPLCLLGLENHTILVALNELINNG